MESVELLQPSYDVTGTWILPVVLKEPHPREFTLLGSEKHGVSRLEDGGQVEGFAEGAAAPSAVVLLRHFDLVNQSKAAVALVRDFVTHVDYQALFEVEQWRRIWF